MTSQCWTGRQAFVYGKVVYSDLNRHRGFEEPSVFAYPHLYVQSRWDTVAGTGVLIGTGRERKWREAGEDCIIRRFIT
jgi:hypothetical protein